MEQFEEEVKKKIHAEYGHDEDEKAKKLRAVLINNGLPVNSDLTYFEGLAQTCA